MRGQCKPDRDNPDEARKPDQRNEKQQTRLEQVQPAEFPRNSKYQSENDDPSGQELHERGGDGYSRHEQAHRYREARSTESVGEIKQAEQDRRLLGDLWTDHRPADERGSDGVEDRQKASEECNPGAGGPHPEEPQLADGRRAE